MKKKFVLIVLIIYLFSLIVLSGCLSKTDSIFYDGERRFYNIYIPESYDSSKSYPLVFVFHGGGGNANNIEEVNNI